MKEIEEDGKKIIHVPGLGKLILFKYAYPHIIFRFR
jgi:hypothetical protein